MQAVYSPIAKDYVLYNQKSYEGEVINAKMWLHNLNIFIILFNIFNKHNN